MCSERINFKIINVEMKLVGSSKALSTENLDIKTATDL